MLAQRLAKVPGLDVDLSKVQTNMVYVGTTGTSLPAAEISQRLEAAGVWCLDEAPWTLRFVTHLDLQEGDVEEAGEIVAQVVERAAG